MQTEIVISQIFILAVAVVIGAIAAKFKILTNESKDMLSKVIYNISLPLMLFTKYLRLETTPELIKNSLIVLLISILVILILYSASLLQQNCSDFVVPSQQYIKYIQYSEILYFWAFRL